MTSHKRRLVTFLLALLGILLVLFWVKNLLVSFLLAFIFVFIMNPIVEILEKRRISRIWGTLIICSLAGLISFILFAAIFPPISQQFFKLQSDWPQYAKSTDQALQRIMGVLDDYFSMETVYDLIARVQTGAATAAQKVFADIPNYISNSLTVLFLTPFLTFFMLLDGPQFLQKVLSLAPPTQAHLVRKIANEVSIQIGGFIRARLLESAIVGIVIWGGLLVLGFPYALLLAFFAAVLNLIPYLGPIIGLTPAFLIAFSLGFSTSGYLWLTLIYGLAQVIDVAIIVPILVARIVNLHPVVVVLSVMLGAELMGILGMIISIPVSSALKVIIESIYAELVEKD